LSEFPQLVAQKYRASDNGVKTAIAETDPVRLYNLMVMDANPTYRSQLDAEGDDRQIHE
jgi:hypothetical protein